MLRNPEVFLPELVLPTGLFIAHNAVYTANGCIWVHVFLEHVNDASECYNTSAVARAVAIGCSEVALQVNVSVVRAHKTSE